MVDLGSVEEGTELRPFIEDPTHPAFKNFTHNLEEARDKMKSDFIILPFYMNEFDQTALMGNTASNGHYASVVSGTCHKYFVFF